MSETSSPEVQTSGSLDAIGSGSDALLGMAALGKTAAALALVIAIILACTYLLRRWNNYQQRHGARLGIVGSTAVGNRERVVVVEIEGVWLVLGVGNGNISKLHELPAPLDRTPPASSPPDGQSPDVKSFDVKSSVIKSSVMKSSTDAKTSFSTRLATALRQGKRSSNRHRDSS
ncbi:flagellar biosynthetic protein FliO [Halomonas sp. Bachu 37]|uniref:flagellar biosynthetic protein FliO n=1 Tax=Halomonas kashgarensis TaxID=3084920 RepID=UPI003216F5AC